MGVSPRLLSRVRWNLLPVATVVLFACGDPTSPPEPAGLVFSAVPINSTVAGASLPLVSVSVVDADGHLVTSAKIPVTLSITTSSGTGTLSGSLTTNAVNGIATFANLSINRIGFNYTLSASSPSLPSATSTPFAIIAGAGVKLAFTIQPGSGIANAQIPAFTIEVQDLFGNRTQQNGSSINLVLASNSTGASLIGTVIRSAVNGTVSFPGLLVTKPGRYTINAVSPSLVTATSEPFDMIIGPPAKLAFTRVPSLVNIGEVFDPPPTVAIFDEGNNPIVSGSYSITLSLAPSQSSGTLSGTTTVASSDGIAAFPGLSISALGTDYKILATSPSIAGSTMSNPIVVRNQLVLSSVSAGYFHTCGRGVDGRTYCWGDNTSGQLGMIAARSLAALPVASSLEFRGVSAGRAHTCGLVADGTAYCWGENGVGQSGSNFGSIPTRVFETVKFAAIAAGYNHSCGMDLSGKGYCWGENRTGELGSQAPRGSFAPVSGSISFSNITAGRGFSCGVAVGGAAYCWGDNSSGAVGDGSLIDRFAPAAVAGGLTFKFVQAGGFHSCGLTTDGKAWCWGENAWGQLGNNGTVSSNVPVPVAGSLTFASLSVGNRHNCGVTVTGQGYCWGDNSTGMLGMVTEFVTVPVPTLVSGGLSFISVSAGRFHTCGITTTAAYCWGSSALGTGSDEGSPVPVRVR